MVFVSTMKFEQNPARNKKLYSFLKSISITRGITLKFTSLKLWRTPHVLYKLFVFPLVCVIEIISFSVSRCGMQEHNDILRSRTRKKGESEEIL